MLQERCKSLYVWVYLIVRMDYGMGYGILSTIDDTTEHWALESFIHWLLWLLTLHLFSLTVILCLYLEMYLAMCPSMSTGKAMATCTHIPSEVKSMVYVATYRICLLKLIKQEGHKSQKGFSDGLLYSTSQKSKINAITNLGMG